MDIDIKRIISDVTEWLKDSGVNVNLLSSSGKDGYRLLVLELSGQPVNDLVEKYGSEGGLLLRWLLPRFKNGNIEVEDFRRHRAYLSGYIFRRPEFDRDKRGDIAPLHLCPDLDKGSVFPAWYLDVEFKWRRFALNIKGRCSLDNFIKLESGLNAIFTSGAARQAGRFIVSSASNENPLLALEKTRQVLIDWPTETLGRLRIPHKSHKNRLCPFQTPESKRIGLQLNIAADAEIGDGVIKEGSAIFSIATGLIPYPHHTDGPRLMMGGKNMKQAETGISGAEAPIVPGYYEGIYASEFPVLRPHIKDGRFFPYLGLNALTVIMPFKGYTYEDGLVISKSLASRLRIQNSGYSYTKTFDVVVIEPELREKGIGIDTIFSFKKGEKFVYGDALPGPLVKFHDKENPEIEKVFCEKYDHHAAGFLEDIEVKHVIKKESGRKTEKRYSVEFIVSWKFRVERPMEAGDKLTGRNGNKGVVTKILPDEKMPKVHFSDTTVPAELIISPCSILGRKNLGQIWEMTHSLLIMKGGAKLNELLDETGIDIKNVRLDGFNDAINGDNLKKITGRLGEFLKETGCDEFGTFDVSFDGRHVRAFAGWQYFCRLHHHAWKKLQARGVKAPCDSRTGQPVRCGALTGQRMGEMENWAFLSHGAESVLSGMREKNTGDYEKTRDLFRKVLRSLGLTVAENISGLEFRVRNHDNDNLKKKTLRTTLSSDSGQSSFCGIISKNKTPRDVSEEILRNLTEKQSSPRAKTAAKKLQELLNGYFFNEDGSIHVEPEVLDYSAELKFSIDDYGSTITLKHPPLRKLLLKFCIDQNPLERAEALINYRDGLIKILSGKTGIPRYYMSGRRYNHSGRAVIVPEPSLNVDSVYLPAAMLIELLEGYDRAYTDIMPEELKNISRLRKIFNDYDNNKHEAGRLAGKFDDVLNTERGALWCFLIRQPSLHRHSVQAFRIRCWELPVIGVPPMVTPGFNADFDGDTMAVFLPPYEYAKNLERFSILNNPGLVGNGKPAFAASLDLALGWWNTQEGAERKKLSSHLSELLRNTLSSELRETLRKLQVDVAENSSGSATLTPVEFERLLRDISDNEFKEGLMKIIASGAKGSHDDVVKMVKEIGNIDMMNDDDSEATHSVFIRGNFWQGLSDDELFDYSYPSRYAMAQKKLAVADAGYFSRLLAEKMYEYTVSVHDCGTSEGIEVSYSKENDRLIVDGTIMPSSGNLYDDAERVLWGRILVGENKCLNSNDVKRITDALKEGMTVKLRSPIHCREREKGHVCAMCYGADAASKPYDRPEPVPANFAAGLTAAAAIGERGTQLAMKRFHNVAATQKEQNETSIKEVRQVLVSKEMPLLSEVITKILTVDDKEHTANKELPQLMIHFETVSACKQREGDDKFISDMAGEKISRLLERENFHFTDDFNTIKSRLLWKG